MVFSFWAIFFVFSTPENSSYVYLLHILLSWIRIRITKAAGSGSALRKTTGSGSAKNECRSTSLPVPVRFSKIIQCCGAGYLYFNQLWEKNIIVYGTDFASIEQIIQIPTELVYSKFVQPWHVIMNIFCTGTRGNFVKKQKWLCIISL